MAQKPSQPRAEWSHFSHNAPLQLNLLHAAQQSHGFPRHSHNYYVIAVVEQGVQGFQFNNQRYTTPPGGFIFLNPGEAHTGEPVDAQGYRYRAMYPEEEHIRTLAAHLQLSGQGPLRFFAPRGEHSGLAHRFLRMHRALSMGIDALQAETLYTETLAEIVARFAGAAPAPPGGLPRQAVRKAQDYIQAHLDQSFSLDSLAAHVNLSRYHLLRVFRQQVGLPPHSYLAALRVRRAQELIARGQPLAQVAVDVGFSSQSHLSQQFKRILGVTPGVYAQELQAGPSHV